MKLIKPLDEFQQLSTRRRRLGLFLCPVCKKQIKRSLVNGSRQKSCGCKYQFTKERHGDTGTRLHRIWQGMLDRCYRKRKASHLKYYYHKGIKVCDEWRHSYISFKRWAVKNGYKDSLEIDRIDGDGSYTPDNCRWVTHKENMRNSSCAKITAEQAKEIIHLKESGLMVDISKFYPITKGQIDQIGVRNWI